MRINYLLLLSFISFQSGLLSQSALEIDAILRDSKEVPKILMVGTFHFGYPGLDSHVTDEAYKVDITSPERQEEVQELVDYTARFKPTKIMVESGPNTGYLMTRFRDWKKKKVPLRKREIDQIAFRLMDEFDIDTLYGIDANSFARDYGRSADSTRLKPIFDKIFTEVPDSMTSSSFDSNYWDWYDQQDKKCVEMPLLDYFLDMNSDHQIKRMHGHYILSDKTDNYNAVDGLILNWYSRNLRIMKNIQMIETDASDRILLLIGAGHVSILKQQFESTPEYDLIEFSNLQSVD